VIVSPGWYVVTFVPRLLPVAPHGPAFCSVVRAAGALSWMCALASAGRARIEAVTTARITR